MAANKENSKVVVHECFYNCNSRSHLTSLAAAISIKHVTDEKVASYLKWCCLRYPKGLDSYGRTTVHLAASTGRLKLLVFLLKHRDVDINEKDKESHYTALHRSILYGQIHCAVRLIEYGANVEQLDLDYLTPLDHSVLDRSDDLSYDHREPCEVYVWGVNTNYTLGIGHNHSRTNPEPLDFFRRQGFSIKQVIMSKFHSLFVCTDGRVYTCGHGRGGRLGHDDELTVLTPKVVKIGAKNSMQCKMAAVGVDHTVLLMENKSVWSCGLNTYHQLGHSPPPEKVLSPKAIKALRDVDIIGICASKFHSAFWTKTKLYTCGLNGGQLGHIKSSEVTLPLPKMVTSVNLKEAEIHHVACSEGATVLGSSEGDVYLLYEYQCKKILSRARSIKLKKICVVGGHLNYKINTDCLQERGGEELKIVIMSVNNIYLWQESIGEVIPCELSIRRPFRITDIALNKLFMLLVFADGKAFQGEMKLKKRKSLREMERSRKVANDINAKEDYAHIKLKRIPNIHRGVCITSDLKGRNFAVTQTHPNLGLISLPVVVSTNMKEDMTALLETVEEFDRNVDVLFEVEGMKFPCHRFIVSHSSEVFEEMIRDADSVDGVQHVKLSNIKPQIFRRILYFIYTRDCDLLHAGVCPISTPASMKANEIILDSVPENFYTHNNELISAYEYHLRTGLKRSGGKKKKDKDDPVKLLRSAAKRFMLIDLEEKLENVYYENGYIFVEKRDNSLLDFNIKFDRKKLQHLWDVSLKSEEGSIINAHKCILVSRMEYFNCMINHGWLESTQKTAIHLPIPVKVLKVLINYLYTDDATDMANSEDMDLATLTLVIADQFFCARLKKYAEFSLAKLINLKNAVDMLQLSETYNAYQLKYCAMEFICLNLSAVLESRYLETLDDNLLVDLKEFYQSWLSCMKFRVIPTYSNAPDVEFINLISKMEPVSLDTIEECSPSKLTSKTPKKKARVKRNSESGRTRNISAGSATSEEEPELIINDLCQENEDDDESWVKVVNHSTKHQKVRAPVEAAKLETKPVKEEKFVSLNKIIMKEPELPKLEKKIQLFSGSLEKDFPSLDESRTEKHTRQSVTPRHGDVEVFNKFVKLSQKQRKRLSSQSMNEENITPNVPKQEGTGVGAKSPWAKIINESQMLDEIMKQESRASSTAYASSPPWQETTKPGSSLSAVMASERRQREYFARIKSKPLEYTQMEDRAIEDLLIRYNANEVTDERITVRRADYKFNIAPVWVSNRK